MKRWPWRRILLSVAAGLIVVGLAPLAILMIDGMMHNTEPVSMPIPLKKGEYASPLFTTDAKDVYQVEIYFLPFGRTPLNLDWKIVDADGHLIQSGVYLDRPGGNDAILTQYPAKRGSRQRVILDIHEDVQAPATSNGQPALHVGLPERGLDMAYGLYAAMILAGVISGPGAAILLVLIVLRILRRQKIPVGA